jgi:probable HAF family extracellular repeat protein
LVSTVTSGAEAAPLAARDRPCRPIEQVVATDLGDLGGDSGTTAMDLNDRGQVVGVADTPFDEGHAFVWQQGVIADLTPSVRGYSNAVAIDTHGPAT